LIPNSASSFTLWDTKPSYLHLLVRFPRGTLPTISPMSWPQPPHLQSYPGDPRRVFMSGEARLPVLPYSPCCVRKGRSREFDRRRQFLRDHVRFGDLLGEKDDIKSEDSGTRSVGFECGSLFGLPSKSPNRCMHPYIFIVQHAISAILFVSDYCPVGYRTKAKKKRIRRTCHHTTPY
jgi:hypothetical protein